jgi:hypothetical protein
MASSVKLEKYVSRKPVARTTVTTLSAII